MSVSLEKYERKLIDLFGGDECASVLGGGEYRELCDEHKDHPFFNRARYKIERLKHWLEVTVGMRSTPRGQVEQALRCACSVGRGRPSERLVVYFKGLVGRAYRGSWSRAQREYFDTAAERLGHCNDYFLSFTNQPHLESAVKPLNRDYVLLIQYALGVGRREVLRSRENMVAHVLRHVFEDRGLRGFFFLDHVGDQSVLLDKLGSEIDRSLVFVQLLQREMFLRRDAGQNLCLWEYNRAIKSLGEDGHFAFVLAPGRGGGLPEDDLIGLDYFEWHRAVNEKDMVILERPRNRKDADKLLQLIYDRVAQDIKEHVKRVYEGVPE